jgi:hypothetical protein
MNISAEVKRLAFENIGQGFTVAAGWFQLNGQAHWVGFTATRTGTGRRRAAVDGLNGYPLACQGEC